MSKRYVSPRPGRSGDFENRSSIVGGQVLRAVLLGSALLALACGAAQVEQPGPLFATSEEQPAVEVPSEAPQCVDQFDKPATCEADSDCCSGFVCGKDPELSHRVSYCIFGG